MSIENITITTKPRPPYLLGLLCLIPLIGAFVGIGLLLYAIFKYKDKWLAIIGIFGIVFTVAVYSFLFYYMKHGELSKKGFASISQMHLNSLIKDIEFYKLENNQYPDSLQQLLAKDKLVLIYDPIQSVQQRDNTIYNYGRVGNNYFLFSSGQDGIPKTNDDLFPQVTISDSSKIGLIKLP
jgi:hypothetical protein